MSLVELSREDVLEHCDKCVNDTAMHMHARVNGQDITKWRKLNKWYIESGYKVTAYWWLYGLYDYLRIRGNISFKADLPFITQRTIKIIVSVTTEQ